MHAVNAKGPVRIAMWSGPRNISTAMMRAWENREDTWVWDEPLYAYYLQTTGLDHPGAEEVIAAGEAWGLPDADFHGGRSEQLQRCLRGAPPQPSPRRTHGRRATAVVARSVRRGGGSVRGRRTRGPAHRAGESTRPVRAVPARRPGAF